VVSDPLFPVVDARAAAAAANGTGSVPGFELDELREFDVRAEQYPGGLDGALHNLEESRRSISRQWGVEIGGFYSVMRCGGPVTVSYTTAEILGEMAPRFGWWCLGPLMDTAPPRGANGGRPLIYVAMGTFFNYSHDAFMCAIEALAGEPVDVVVSTGRGYVSPADLEPLPANVEVHEFVDSRSVLARAAVHVTHGGGSSVHESLLAGVPMVCLPQGSDQFMWAQRITELGAGEVVPTAAGAIRTAVRRLLEDDGPRRTAQALGERLATHDGNSGLATLIGELIGQEEGARGVSSSSARGRASEPSETGTS
jgi:MGT family glycosyltransferase